MNEDTMNPDTSMPEGNEGMDTPTPETPVTPETPITPEEGGMDTPEETTGDDTPVI